MSAYDTEVMADSPKLYVASSALADSSGNGHTVTAVGSPSFSTLPNGDTGFLFSNAGNQHVQVPDNNMFSVPATGSLTFECWMYPSALIQPHDIDTGYVNFFGKADWVDPPAANQYEWQLRFFSQDETDPGNLGLDVCAYAFNLPGGLGHGHNDHDGHVVGQWVHYAGVINTASVAGYPNGYVKIYRNGVLKATDTLSAAGGVPLVTPGNGTAPVRFGAGEDLTNHWYGGIGKVAIYGSELTAARLLAHYNAMYASAAFTGSAYDQAVLNDVPVLYLPGLTDVSGKNHTVTTGGSPTPTASTTMPNGDTAVVYNGVNQYLQVLSASDISISSTNDSLTIEAWIRPDVLDFVHDEGSGYVHWAGKGEGSGATGTHEWVCRMYGTDTPGESPPRPNRISGYCFNASGGLGVGSYFQDSLLNHAWIYYVLVITTVPYTGTDPAGWPLNKGYTQIYKNSVPRDKDGLNQAGGSIGVIVPTAGNAPVRIGTRDFASFFQGAIGKFAIYDKVLTDAQIVAHYDAMLPYPKGSALYQATLANGLDLINASGSSNNITVGTTVAAGTTIVARIGCSYTAGSPLITDSKGNTWTMAGSAKDAGNTMRVAQYYCQVLNALIPTDTITVTWSNTPSLPLTRQVAFDQFASLGTVDVINQASYTSTIQPGLNIPLAPTGGNTLVIGTVAFTGDTSVGYAQYAGYTGLSRTGSSGRPFTVGAGFRSYGTYVVMQMLSDGRVRPTKIPSQYIYAPTFTTPQNAVELVVAYNGLGS